jgi:HSP20 family protein
MEKTSETRTTIVPAADVCQEGDKVYLRLEMPGVAKDEISVRIENDSLLVTGSRSDQTLKGSYAIRERSNGDYFKQYTIDETIDRDRIDAVMRAGVLNITLYVKEAAKPKKIEIKVK